MIAIVGGGISGLALAHGLVSRGARVQVLEAASRAGGTIQTHARDGFLTEAGPNGFLDREPATRALAEALGLLPKLRPAGPVAKRRLVYLRGALREVPLSPPGFMRSDLLPASAKLRAALDLVLPRGKADDESLADFVRRRLGKTEIQSLVDAVQTGIYAGDFERLSVGAAFPFLVEAEREHRSLVLGMVHTVRKRRREAAAGQTGALTSFEGGLETLVSALSRSLGEAVRLGAKVSRLSRAGEGWRLELESGGAVEAARVVLAVPAYVAAQLLRPLEPSLADELESIEYASVAVVHLAFRKSDLASPPEAFGFIVPSREKRPILGTIYASSIFPFRAPGDGVLFTCMAGGALQPERVELPDEELLLGVREELARLTGVSARPLFHQLIRWRRGIPQYNVGHLARVERIERLASALPGLSLTGNALRGVGMNDCIRNSERLAERLAPR